MKGLTALMLFILASAAVEYLAVIYAVSLGVEDPNPLQLSLQFPATGWKMVVTVSLIFHIVPLAAIITLTLSWVCLTKYLNLSASKPSEQKFKRVEGGKRKFTCGISQTVKCSLQRVKAALMKNKSFASLWSRVSHAKTVVKSSLIMLFAFLALFAIFSLAAYPKLFLNLYWNSPSTLGLVIWMGNAARAFAETLTPLWWVCKALNDSIIASAPSIRAFAANFTSIIKPLTDLTPAGKYLFLQNFAVWVSALAVLVYGVYVRRSYRYRKARKG